MNCKGCGRKRSWSNLRYYLIIWHRDQERRQYVRIAGHRAEIWSIDLPSRNPECLSLGRDFRLDCCDASAFTGEQETMQTCVGLRAAECEVNQRSHSSNLGVCKRPSLNDHCDLRYYNQGRSLRAMWERTPSCLKKTEGVAETTAISTVTQFPGKKSLPLPPEDKTCALVVLRYTACLRCHRLQ
jgi:hypothetical protein